MNMRTADAHPETNVNLELSINGQTISARPGTTVAALLMQLQIPNRKSISGEPRAPLCAMGICMECCATVNGVEHVPTCQLFVEQGMKIVTQ
jgi:sarcosine oxidase subunit alpha